MSVWSGAAGSVASPLRGHSWVVGHWADFLVPSCEADPRTSWMLSPSGSGRVSLMSFGARRVRGVLPVWIKPVVAQASCVPGLYGRIGAWVRPRSAPHAEPTGGSLRRRRDPTPWVTVGSATFARSRAIVTAFARWPDLADEQVGGRRDDAGR